MRMRQMAFIDDESAYFQEVRGYRGRYFVSLDGRVYSTVSNKFLKACINNAGYPMVTLTGSNGDQQAYPVHRLVARHFVDGYFAGAEVNHINGDKTDNNFWNLEWVTREENLRHAVRNGFVDTKYKVKQMIKDIYALGVYTQKQIGDLVGLSQAQISYIINDKVYNY